LVVLPFLLTGLVLLFDRIIRRLGEAVLPSTVVPRQVLLLAALSILTHPILDTLNTYGVRWLMPFRSTWFYGDTLFIVDPWMWLILGAGVALSRDRRRTRPARMALAVGIGYVAGMALLGSAARHVAMRELSNSGGRPERLMLSPRLMTPLVRDMVAVEGERYRVGTFRWLSRPHIDTVSLRSVPRPRADDPALTAARGTELGHRFLEWARFPAVSVTPRAGGGSLVHLVDLRYADGPGARFGAVTVPLLVPPAFAPSPDTAGPSPRAAAASPAR
jgi:inner membrane protein